ncbi:hypothetical protein PUNSTDRAFT_83122 [Punctularia strigosozonata HHB-11173 SS5]|uniref:uncharacterized protein n=1 Tax=Punctularia strigosozonata (strain HHB-11173) TaxID=741275 RepID=UPI0004416FD4|nr:uncharacterized protein PUNSTDRAFT_83122 [Punctularia strigosozonata HHB-11173 SS5]EIN11502.1 hypothetical protein PUNSTDRAFT_83122 [Punctularia strigosozonata HHB-11173 SS5]
MNPLTLRRRLRHLTRTAAQDRLVTALRLSWLVLVFWSEIGSLFWRLSSCSWPDSSLNSSKKGGKKWEKGEDKTEKDMKKGGVTHVLLVADPQLRHPVIYGNSLSWRQTFWEWMRTVSLRRRWKAALGMKKPDRVIIMGDMMLGREIMTDEEYDQYFQTFLVTFPSKSIPVHYIPGNDDLGLGPSPTFSKHARRLYTSHFGPPNQALSVANHTLVLLDAPGLVEEDYRRVAAKKGFDEWVSFPGGALDLIQTVAEREEDGDVTRPEEPVILFSHIPLHRPESASCGPLRERGRIRKGVGYGYQNTLGKQTTQWILNVLKPAMIFSADDRDYCDYTHVSPSAPSSPRVREVTVKSFSSVRHIRHPGIHLLSLSPPSTSAHLSPTFADAPCFLPDDLRNIRGTYTPLALLTFFVLLIAHIYRLSSKGRGKPKLRLDSALSTGNGQARSGGPVMLSARMPESAVWSPISPALNSVSMNGRPPRSPLPRPIGVGAGVRTPSIGGEGLSTPTLRAASVPGTPLASSRFNASRAPYDVEDDEEDHDPMSPAQFAYRRDQHEMNGYGAPHHVPDDDDEDDEYVDEEKDAGAGSYFLPAPGSRAAQNANRRWAYTFEFRGRRRRIALPGWLVAFLGDDAADGLSAGSRRRRAMRILGVVMRRTAGVLWPAGLLWIILLWWTS